MRFVWDEKKNLDNIKKHKISFIQAARVFFDPLRKESYDYEHSGLEEDRTTVIGFAGDNLLFVNFTELDSETIRIISARKAKNHEKEDYHGNG